MYIKRPKPASSTKRDISCYSFTYADNKILIWVSDTAGLGVLQLKYFHLSLAPLPVLFFYCSLQIALTCQLMSGLTFLVMCWGRHLELSMKFWETKKVHNPLIAMFRTHKYLKLSYIHDYPTNELINSFYNPPHPHVCLSFWRPRSDSLHWDSSACADSSSTRCQLIETKSLR